MLDPVLARSDWVTCNARESALLTGVADPLGAAGALAQRAGRRGVLVRTGAAGCLLVRHGLAPVRVPGFTVERFAEELDAHAMCGAGYVIQTRSFGEQLGS